ncbi:MAG: 50S ribosomal protein L18a [Candidatus Diapherotrites archaeon]|uniref:Large ribosomal subunit protein eL20 n=1 Tax=Candidatus Iainarchaeum sp. TaxID=3101447 RepID=A0A8T4L922_9ARCH|nr:50S ribosomal protein L18a [Candidatus Diapherotrites archaeon]
MKKQTTKTFEIKGTVQFGEKNVPFVKKVSANNANHASEKVLTLFGSKNKVKRRSINITESKETKE